MYHLGAYYLSVGQTALSDMTAVNDGIITIQNSHFLPQEPLSIVALMAMSAHLTAAQINSPKIRQITPSNIRPINAAALPANNYNLQMYTPDVLKVNGQEELQMLVTSSLGSGNEDAFGLVWFMDQMIPVPQGDVYNCVFTSTTTAVSQAWTKVSYTLSTLLPAGKYAMIWSELFSTNGIAHRWTFDNQYFRPGMVSQAAVSSRHPYDIYQGLFGTMGYFYTFSLPRLEVLCDSTDNSFTGYFQVVRVADNAAVGSLGMMGMKG